MTKQCVTCSVVHTAEAEVRREGTAAEADQAAEGRNRRQEKGRYDCAYDSPRGTSGIFQLDQPVITRFTIRRPCSDSSHVTVPYKLSYYYYYYAVQVAVLRDSTTICFGGNGARHINEATLRQTRLSPVTTRGGSIPSRHSSRPLRPTQPGHPSVGRCNDCTGNGFGHLWEETAPLKLRPYGAFYYSHMSCVSTEIRTSQCYYTVVLLSFIIIPQPAMTPLNNLQGGPKSKPLPNY